MNAGVEAGRRYCKGAAEGSVRRSAWLVVAALLALSGCASRAPAPVVQRVPPAQPAPPAARTPPPAAAEASPAAAARGGAPVIERDTRPELHVVRKGETLFSIALEYGLDYREIAVWNRIDNVNLIRIGQQLRLRPPVDAATGSAGAASPVAPTATRPAEGRPPASAAVKPAADPDGVRTEPRALRQPFSEMAFAEVAAAGRRAGDPATKPAAPAAVAAPATGATAAAEPVLPPKPEAAAAEPLAWGWPATGTLIERFSDTNRGIDIAGKAGQPILAGADGRVVYSGSGIRGYGRMLIVKHNDVYVSVYAHASELLVKEGQSVSRGQRIAEMGNTDSERVKLHFEIRRMGKPIDPLRYLPAEGAS
jgi:lipoprotein NlpD